MILTHETDFIRHVINIERPILDVLFASTLNLIDRIGSLASEHRIFRFKIGGIIITHCYRLFVCWWI